MQRFDTGLRVYFIVPQKPVAGATVLTRDANWGVVQRAGREGFVTDKKSG